MIRQTIHAELLKRLKEKRRFVQVLAGPRQVGKTTVVRQVMEAAKIPAHYASADEPTLRDRTWLEQQWDIARLKARESKAGALLVLDEIQKVTDWSSVVKLLWDSDTHSGVPSQSLSEKSEWLDGGQNATGRWAGTEREYFGQ